MEQSVLYAHSNGEINFLMSQNEIEVFLEILILSGFCPIFAPVSSKAILEK